jgi:hypothetical protein
VDRAVPQAVSPLAGWWVVGWRVDFCLRGVVEVVVGQAEPWAEPGHDTGARGWGGTGYDTGVGRQGGTHHDTGGAGTAW